MHGRGSVAPSPLKPRAGLRATPLGAGGAGGWGQAGVAPLESLHGASEADAPPAVFGRATAVPPARRQLWLTAVAGTSNSGCG